MFSTHLSKEFQLSKKMFVMTNMLADLFCATQLNFSLNVKYIISSITFFFLQKVKYKHYNL